MLRHCVLFSLPAGAEADADRLVAEILAMDGRIDGLVALTAGRHQGPRRGFDVALVADLDDADALARYDAHPVHAPVKALAAELCDGIAAVDFAR